MSSLADRLRGIVASVPAARPRTADLPPPDGDAPAHADSAAEVLGGHWIDVDGSRVLVVDRVYRPGHRHGNLTLVDHVLPGHGRWSVPFLSGRDASLASTSLSEESHRALFIDLETTGLAGGAGTCAFLVGCAWFEDSLFRVRQLFMSNAAIEQALLTLLTDLAATAHLVVSFNGKSFDLPLIETRFLFHRRSTPFASLPHLDMLHPARRMWRADESDAATGGCRLGVLEESICGHLREGDVPGFEIPARYFHYVRSGDARPLAAVFEHNRLDLLSLAFLTARAAQLADEGLPLLRTAREAVGLGQLFERAGDAVQARRCFARAAGMDGASPLPGDEVSRAEAMHGYATLCRRARRYAEAAGAWRQLLEIRRCPETLLRHASEALAVHHEHRLRDPQTARSFALKSASLPGTSSRRQALEHRLARLERKLVAQPLRLF